MLEVTDGQEDNVRHLQCRHRRARRRGQDHLRRPLAPHGRVCQAAGRRRRRNLAERHRRGGEGTPLLHQREHLPLPGQRPHLQPDRHPRLPGLRRRRPGLPCRGGDGRHRRQRPRRHPAQHPPHVGGYRRAGPRPRHPRHAARLGQHRLRGPHLGPAGDVRRGVPARLPAGRARQGTPGHSQPAGSRRGAGRRGGRLRVDAPRRCARPSSSATTP